MQIQAMRIIDKYIGIPLCFLLSIFIHLIDLIRLVKPQTDPGIKKILLIKLSEMGAIALTYPLLKYIQEQYPKAQVYFLVFEKNAHAIDVLKEVVDKNRVFTIKDDSLGQMVASSIEALTKIRNEKFDVSIDLEFFSRCTAILTYLSGAQKRIGFFRYHFEGLYRGNLFTHKLQYNPLLHCSRSYLSLGEVIGEEKKDTPELKPTAFDRDMAMLRFHSSDEGQANIKTKLRSWGYQPGKELFLINPGEGMLPIREWPLENYIALTKRILTDPNRMVAIVGRDCTTKKDELLHKAVGDTRCINLVNKTDVEELLELCCFAKVLVANDCGLVHFAALTPIKKFVFFGPESPQIFAPLDSNTHVIYSNASCSPCLSVLNHRNSSCQDNQCLKVISVDHVYDLLHKLK